MRWGRAVVPEGGEVLTVHPLEETPLRLFWGFIDIGTVHTAVLLVCDGLDADGVLGRVC